jgi:hypothetical protein
MAQNAPHDGPVGDGGDDPQEAVVTPGASVQVDGEDALEELGQPQRDEAELACASLPSWRGVGVMAPHSWLWTAKQPPYWISCTRGGINAARFSNRSNGDSLIPIVPSDQARVKVEMTSPLVSCSRRSRDTASRAARENRFCHFYSQRNACLMSMLSAILNDLEDELPP